MMKTTTNTIDMLQKLVFSVSISRMPQAFGELTLLPKLEDYLLIETFGTGREGYNASHCMCLFPGESDFLTVIRGWMSTAALLLLCYRGEDGVFKIS
ncbi:hypothetical protein F2Q69_00001972 [Brassica cretica]|uniref:Uncharacterized protein n=1 Tax=Brassica cretica TaxID=69181 RepID=A0A8S9PHJ8_BRACR|nr:hypothetical protein F2Q69_00001972 [Brassica cretica]